MKDSLTVISDRHEAERKLYEALERQARVEGKIRSFFANIAVKRAENAVLSARAEILAPMAETSELPPALSP